MNRERFIIIDDDVSICQMLANIIEDNDLGEVVEQIHDGSTGIDLIPKFKPDIVFVDLLLPDIDGIEIVKRLKKAHPNIDFIMISQVSDTDMITEAYESGIQFYINKPINVIEVISVTKRVVESLRNRRVIEQIGHTLNRNQPEILQHKEKNLREKIQTIFAELGILSERGSDDLAEMILRVNDLKNSYQMSELYKYLGEQYKTHHVKRSGSSKAIEQRVRRTIQVGLVNIAHLGIEDFSNYKFDRYASLLYSFQEVKRTMDGIRQKSNIKPTINTKQFINGILSMIEQ